MSSATHSSFSYNPSPPLAILGGVISDQLHATAAGIDEETSKSIEFAAGDARCIPINRYFVGIYVSALGVLEAALVDVIPMKEYGKAYRKALTNTYAFEYST